MSAVVYHFREVMRCKILRLASMPSSTNGGNFIHIEWKSWGYAMSQKKTTPLTPRGGLTVYIGYSATFYIKLLLLDLAVDI